VTKEISAGAAESPRPPRNFVGVRL